MARKTNVLKHFYSRDNYMPLKLKRILASHNIVQSEWSNAIMKSNGKPISKALGSLILNWNQFPSLTSPDDIKKQTASFLKANGVDKSEIATAWQIDKHDEPYTSPIDVTRRAGHSARSNNNDNPEIDLPEPEMLTETAKRHFKLFRDPFVDDVQKPDDVFMSTEHRYVREAMFMTAKLGGFLAVVGECGAGKTILRRDLIDRIQRETLPITVIQPRIIDKGRLTAGAICESIISDISQERPKQSLEAKARQIEKLLMGSSRAGNAHVLIIEEAHDLSIKTLKFLKRFWELEDGFKKLLAIILVGQPELQSMLNERVNWEAREVIRRCEIVQLMPLDGNLEQYIALKFDRMNIDHKSLFDNSAYDAIRQRLSFRQRGVDTVTSMMYPLVVNNCVVKALNLAADIGAKKVNGEIISEV